jgi:hypothetical protein
VREYRKWGGERMGTDSGLRDGGREYFVGTEKEAGLVIM